MDKKLTPQKEDKLKSSLSGLSRVKTTENERRFYFSRIAAKIEEPKGAFNLGATIALRLRDAASGAIFALSRTPALARVAALIFIFISVYTYAYLPQSPVIQNVEGTVKIYDPSTNEWTFAKENQRLKTDYIIKTFDDGQADITLKGTYSMRVKEGSEMRLSRAGSRAGLESVRFDVAKGRILTYYSKVVGKSGKGFEVKTDESLASVVGTNFMVESLPQLNKTFVGVLDGIVRVESVNIPKNVTSKEATVYVTSRYGTEITRGSIPKKPKVMLEDKWLELKELYSIGKKTQVALLVSTGPSRTRELLAMAPLYISEEGSSILPEKLTRLARDFNKAAKEDSRELHLKNIAQFEDIVRKYPNAQYNIQFLLFIGAYYGYVDEYQKAIDTFQEVIDRYPRSYLASIAECAIGIIYEEKLNDKAAAKKAYLAILSKYPDSPEKDEALAGLKRISR